MDRLRHKLEERFGPQRLNLNSPQILHNESSKATSLFITVHDATELVDVVVTAKNEGCPYFIYDLEGDENTIPENFNGLVIKNNARKIDVLARKGKIYKGKSITDFALIEAESGVPFSQVVRFSLDSGFGGIEEGIGVKGSLRSLFLHENMYLASLRGGDIIQSLKILTDKEELTEIGFSEYNKSLLVLSVVFKLHGEDPKILWLKAQKASSDRGVGA